MDFVVSRGSQTWAVEVKSGRGHKAPGLAAFRQNHPEAKVWLVGGTGVPLSEFFSRSAADWFDCRSGRFADTVSRLMVWPLVYDAAHTALSQQTPAASVLPTPQPASYLDSTK